MDRHRLDPGAVAAGFFFLAVAGIFMAGGFAGDPVLPLPVLVPALLIGLGVVGIVRVITRSRRRDPR